MAVKMKIEIDVDMLVQIREDLYRGKWGIEQAESVFDGEYGGTSVRAPMGLYEGDDTQIDKIEEILDSLGVAYESQEDLYEEFNR